MKFGAATRISRKEGRKEGGVFRHGPKLEQPVSLYNYAYRNVTLPLLF